MVSRSVHYPTLISILVTLITSPHEYSYIRGDIQSTRMPKAEHLAAYPRLTLSHVNVTLRLGCLMQLRATVFAQGHSGPIILPTSGTRVCKTYVLTSLEVENQSVALGG